MFAKCVRALSCWILSLGVVHGGLLTAGIAHADPITLPGCDGAGDCQTNHDPNKAGCWGDAYVVHTAPVWNLGPTRDTSFKHSIGRVELWYSNYCQTNWTKTIIDAGQPKTTIDQYVYLPGTSLYTTPQVDTATSAFSLQVYAPGATEVRWSVEVYQNKIPVGTSLGGCDGTSCFHTLGDNG